MPLYGFLVGVNSNRPYSSNVLSQDIRAVLEELGNKHGMSVDVTELGEIDEYESDEMQDIKENR